MEYEKNGCYSGNAIEKDGLLYLFYTANYKTENGKIPKQAVAIMDKAGNIEKYINNPIIDGAPVDMTGEIRDPFVFRKDEKYYMLLGAKSKKEKGALLLYTSEDLLQWYYPVSYTHLDVYKRQLYVFSENKAFSEDVITRFSFGGGCVNDTISHVASNYLPFGGIGSSGMGSYHGKSSFDTFTHSKSIVKKSTKLNIKLVLPPYKNRINIIKKVMK